MPNNIKSTNYFVIYHKGVTFTAIGELRLLVDGAYRVPYIISPDGSSAIFDQRCKLYVGNKEVYSPDSNKDGLFKDVREWVAMNPEWSDVKDKASAKAFRKKEKPRAALLKKYPSPRTVVFNEVSYDDSE